MKCNLDCDYCEVGIYGGHNNQTSHPPLSRCLASIDFMYQYVDLYMQTKPKGLKHAVINVYGGESLHHPDIVEILQNVKSKHQSYADQWSLHVTTTTNAVVPESKFAKIIELIDEFTVSYHSGASDKQKHQFKQNVLAAQAAGKNIKCVVLMHTEPALFEDSTAMIDWLKKHNVRYLPRQIEGQKHTPVYQPHQVVWFEKYFNSRSHRTQVSIPSDQDTVDMAQHGRACCGGRQLCADQTYNQRSYFVDNQFPDWYCSVNHFFLYVKQLTEEIFVNKDCKMNFQGSVAPIGTLDRAQDLLSWTRNSIDNRSLPVIQCKNKRCRCGLCAPKAQTLKDYNSIMKKWSRL